MKMNLSKLITSVALTAAMALPLSASADKIMLGVNPDYPPFSSIDKDGKPQGFDIDMGNALCAAMKAECTWVVQEWTGMIPALKAGKFDAILSSMTINEKRKQQIDFTEKYYTSPISFIRTLGSGVKVDKEGIKGLTVAVKAATVAENFMRDAYDDSVNVLVYETQEEANNDLVKTGNVDLVIADTYVLFPFAANADNHVEYVGDHITDPKYVGEGIGIGVRKGEDELRERFNKAIKQIIADGTYQKISVKYFPFDMYGG